MNLEQARFNMIEQQIRPWDVLDPHVLELLAVVRREDFVPPHCRALAFADMELPLLPNEALARQRGQVMLAPRVQARLLQDLNVAKHEKVLHVGTGSGFMAALLGHRAQRVLSLEMDATLAATAYANLQRAGVLNVEVRVADGAQAAGLAADGPFDAILLSGSVAQLPQDLLALLKPGGRFLAVVGDEPVMRATLARLADDGRLAVSQPWDSAAPRLHHFPETPAFQF